MVSSRSVLIYLQVKYLLSCLLPHTKHFVPCPSARSQRTDVTLRVHTGICVPRPYPRATEERGIERCSTELADLLVLPLRNPPTGAAGSSPGSVICEQISCIGLGILSHPFASYQTPNNNRPTVPVLSCVPTGFSARVGLVRSGITGAPLGGLFSSGLH